MEDGVTLIGTLSSQEAVLRGGGVCVLEGQEKEIADSGNREMLTTNFTYVIISREDQL